MVGKNERHTEAIVRAFFEADSSVDDLRIDEQMSGDPTISRLLKRASKSGKGIGKPEFIIQSPSHPDLVVVVECKGDSSKHASSDLAKPADFAVDGALRYAKHLAKSFDVVAIGVSGESKASLRVSNYAWFRGQPSFQFLEDEHGPIEELRPFAAYARLRAFDPNVRKRNQVELMVFSRDLHNYLRDYAKLAEAEKPLVVSAVMIALQDEVFAAGFRKAAGNELPTILIQALERQLRRAQIPTGRQRSVLQPYQFIEHHAVLNRVPKKEALTPLQKIILDVDEHVRPFLTDHPDVDVLGQFYGEFLRYSGGDGKGLGIVLTPRHVTELFVQLADVGPNDTVLDICAGTGGFLISAMAQMDAHAGGSTDLRKRIRERGLVGVEQRPDMFALAVANMILRGDGKANLYQADAFEPKIASALQKPPQKRHDRPNIGLINPPYSQKGEGLDELSFVKAMLDYLAPGGTGIAIVPMSCVIGQSELKAQLMEDHSLVAVMSMPNDLFHKVGVVTCIMVWKAHHPHARSSTGTWFGYWKDDGFVKTKASGRVDFYERWGQIRSAWLDAYRNKLVRPGHSVIADVDAKDEWCAEAHMETDYSVLTPVDLATVARQYALYLVDLNAREGTRS